MDKKKLRMQVARVTALLYLVFVVASDMLAAGFCTEQKAEKSQPKSANTLVSLDETNKSALLEKGYQVTIQSYNNSARVFSLKPATMESCSYKYTSKTEIYSVQYNGIDYYYSALAQYDGTTPGLYYEDGWLFVFPNDITSAVTIKASVTLRLESSGNPHINVYDTSFSESNAVGDYVTFAEDNKTKVDSACDGKISIQYFNYDGTLTTAAYQSGTSNASANAFGLQNVKVIYQKNDADNAAFLYDIAYGSNYFNCSSDGTICQVLRIVQKEEGSMSVYRVPGSNRVVIDTNMEDAEKYCSLGRFYDPNNTTAYDIKNILSGEDYRDRNILHISTGDILGCKLEYAEEGIYLPGKTTSGNTNDYCIQANFGVKDTEKKIVSELTYYRWYGPKSAELGVLEQETVRNIAENLTDVAGNQSDYAGNVTAVNGNAVTADKPFYDGYISIDYNGNVKAFSGDGTSRTYEITTTTKYTEFIGVTTKDDDDEDGTLEIVDKEIFYKKDSSDSSACKEDIQYATQEWSVSLTVAPQSDVVETTQETTSTQASEQQSTTTQISEQQSTTTQAVEQQATTTQTAVQQSTTTQTVGQQTTTTQTVGQQSTTTQAVEQQSTTTQTAGPQSTTTQTAVQQSTTTQTVGQQSTTTQTVGQQSTTTQTAVQQSTTTQTVGQQSTTTQTVGQQSTTTQTAGQQSTTTQAVGQQTTTTQTVGQQSTTTQTAEQQSTTTQTAGQQSTTTQTVGQQGTTTQQNASSSETTTQQNASSSETTTQQNASSSETTTQQNASSSETTTQQNASSSETTTQQNASSSETTTQQNASSSETTTQQNASSSETTTQQNASSSETTTQQNASSSETTTQQNAGNSETTTQSASTQTNHIITLEVSDNGYSEYANTIVKIGNEISNEQSMQAETGEKIAVFVSDNSYQKEAAIYYQAGTVQYSLALEETTADGKWYSFIMPAQAVNIKVTYKSFVGFTVTAPQKVSYTEYVTASELDLSNGSILPIYKDVYNNQAKDISAVELTNEMLTLELVQTSESNGTITVQVPVTVTYQGITVSQAFAYTYQKIKSYQVSVLQEDGQPVAEVSQLMASYGEKVVLSVPADESHKYAFPQITIESANGSVQAQKESDTQYVFTMPAADVTVTVKYKKISDIQITVPKVEGTYSELTKETDLPTNGEITVIYGTGTQKEEMTIPMTSDMYSIKYAEAEQSQEEDVETVTVPVEVQVVYGGISKNAVFTYEYSYRLEGADITIDTVTPEDMSANVSVSRTRAPEGTKIQVIAQDTKEYAFATVTVLTESEDEVSVTVTHSTDKTIAEFIMPQEAVNVQISYQELKQVTMLKQPSKTSYAHYVNAEEVDITGGVIKLVYGDAKYARYITLSNSTDVLYECQPAEESSKTDTKTVYKVYVQLTYAGKTTGYYYTYTEYQVQLSTNLENDTQTKVSKEIVKVGDTISITAADTQEIAEIYINNNLVATTNTDIVITENMVSENGVAIVVNYKKPVLLVADNEEITLSGIYKNETMRTLDQALQAQEIQLHLYYDNARTEEKIYQVTAENVMKQLLSITDFDENTVKQRIFVILLKVEGLETQIKITANIQKETNQAFGNNTPAFSTTQQQAQTSAVTSTTQQTTAATATTAATTTAKTQQTTVATQQAATNSTVTTQENESTVLLVPEQAEVSKIAAKGRKLIVTWKQKEHATAYEIYISTNKNKGYQKVATVPNESQKTTYSYTIKKYKNKVLQKKKQYYVKIRTVNATKQLATQEVVKSIKCKKNGKLSLSIKAVDNAVSYKAMISTKKKAGYKKACIISDSALQKYAKTISKCAGKKVKKGTVYYVKWIITVDNGEKSYGEFSDVVQTKTKG